MRHLLAALLVLLAFGCSILDPGDRQELRDRIRALPPDQEMMEFVCVENNQYGIAGGIPNIYIEKGFGLEKQP